MRNLNVRGFEDSASAGAALKSRELPGVSIWTAQELVCFRVVDNGLFFGIPFELTADPLAVFIVASQQGNQAQMARDGRVVPSFGWGNGWFA